MTMSTCAQPVARTVENGNAIVVMDVTNPLQASENRDALNETDSFLCIACNKNMPTEILFTKCCYRTLCIQCAFTKHINSFETVEVGNICMIDQRAPYHCACGEFRQLPRKIFDQRMAWHMKKECMVGFRMNTADDNTQFMVLKPPSAIQPFVMINPQNDEVKPNIPQENVIYRSVAVDYDATLQSSVIFREKVDDKVGKVSKFIKKKASKVAVKTKHLASSIKKTFDQVGKDLYGDVKIGIDNDGKLQVKIYCNMPGMTLWQYICYFIRLIISYCYIWFVRFMCCFQPSHYESWLAALPNAHEMDNKDVFLSGSYRKVQRINMNSKMDLILSRFKYFYTVRVQPDIVDALIKSRIGHVDDPSLARYLSAECKAQYPDLSLPHALEHVSVAYQQIMLMRLHEQSITNGAQSTVFAMVSW